MEIKVNERERIDKYLAVNTDLSRNMIGKMIDAGAILVNDEETRNSYKLKLDDIISIDEDYSEEVEIVPVKMDLNIVYEDEHIMVINKPSGLVVHPGAGNYDNTLVNGLMYYTNNLSNSNGDERPGIVHRIDKDTSGLLLVAKTNKAHEILSDYFKNKLVKRKYIALLNGIFPHNTATIDAPIGRDKVNRKRMAVTNENAKDAKTHLKVLNRYKGYTLASFELETGRTHQIRVHSAYIGYPIYNDPVYTNKSKGSFGQFLHSSEMDFKHPITGEDMHFECELPLEFSEKIKELEEKSKED